MFAWGSTINGELGVGGIEEEHILAPIPLEWSGADSVIQAACGANHTLLLTNQRQVYSCGSNDYGQLGHDQPRKRPQKVNGLDAHEITSVACGYSHSLGLNSFGQVLAWGSDSLGQLAHNLGSTLQSTPKIIRALTSHHIVQISSGKNHSIALSNNGDIFAWGANNYGQLGIGKTSTFEPLPMLVQSLQGIPFAFITCGGNHTLAVTKSGAVFGWGKNTAGQLGLNDTISKSYPSQIRSLRTLRICYVSCGEDFSAFLTMDGGVFTCGAGIYGQLGHGSTTNEVLPKKVLELMGSTITQIQCGREHTLALVPSRQRVYSFGLGGSGQLGSRKTLSSSTPQIVLGPWVLPSGASFAKSGEQPFSIYRIFSGGDHCFVRIINNNTPNKPYDCRNLNPESQIQIIEYGKIHSCLNLTVNAVVDQEVITYLETVFKSLSCINGSFLLDNDDHYSCSSRHHGVDLALAEKIFSLIGRMENQTIKDIIWNSVTQDLLTKLTASPPDVEVLRFYLVLPFYHEFNNPRQHALLHRQYATSLLSLQTQPKRVFVSWLMKSSAEYFEKVVNIFKMVAAYLIRNQHVQPQKTVTSEETLVAVLNVLMLLNKLNNEVEGLKVPYDTFHINDLCEFLNVRIDYVAWLIDKTDSFFLCNYPFIFDAQAKILLLETDQSIQMQSAMNDALRTGLISLFANPRRPAVNQFLILNITREKIVQDTIRELSLVEDSSDLKKPLKVKFWGEEAQDAGGVKKEFFMLLSREILDLKYGMFTEYEETRAIWFSQDSFEDEDMYFLIGQICGLAIYNFTIINIPFPLVLYKKLLKEPVTITDLKDLSPTIANSLQSMIDYKDSDFTDVFDLTFEISRNSFGEVRSIPLKTNGEDMKVSQENKYEYVELYVDYILNKSVCEHFKAFSTGFLKVCGGRVLELFRSHELMAVVIGNENYDWHALEECAEYKSGYKSSDKVIRWFWEVLHGLSINDKKKFLLYLTGSDRIPVQGMKAIKIIIQPTNDEKFLPVAHTCFNLLDLPRYKTKERLKYKLLQAIQQTEGFSLA